MNFRKVLPLSLLALAALLPDAGAQLAARHSHTTTLLPDGNILIAGGVSDAGATRIPGIQMYNMATNTFQAWAGNLNTARSSHTATVMSDGRVLIAGGFTNAAGNPPTADLEICNPISRTCLDTAVNMSAARGGHTATLLTKGANAGKVLLCGGQSAAAATSVTDTCDLFDPAANPPNGAITAATPMVSPRMGHAAVLLKSGNVFVTGGRRRNQAGTAWIYEPTNEMYDVGISSWTPKDALLQGRIDHSATTLNNGLVLIAGGFNAVNTRKCVNDEGEECWSPEDDEAWNYQGLAPDGTAIGPYLQGWGSHGYLDGAELFDQNGGRMVLGESTFGTAPYRFHQHSAVLQPDGVWSMQGGYGGIVRTLFDNSPELEKDSVINTTQLDMNTAAIVPGTTQIKFPLKFVLSRFVSGRIVSGNIYFARNTDYAAAPAISLNEASIYLDHSTAAVDGLPVGTTIDADHNPGDFDSVVTLTNPAGWVDFDPVTLTSDAASDPANLAITAYNLTFAAVNPIDSTAPNSPQNITGSINATVAVTLPSVYRGIRGTVDFNTGSVTDPDETFAIAIEGAGTNTFYIYAPASCPPGTGACVFNVPITIPSITGTITNLQKGTTLQANGANLDADLDGLLAISMSLNFTADEIRPDALQPAFSYSRSNIVISSMIFSSALAYTPAANTWKDLSDTDISPTLSQPVFNHTAVLTPAADTVVLGGRNCETLPDPDCRNRVFRPTNSAPVFVPVYRNADGSDAALKGGKLASPRAFHTSTLLLNGDVLTCGGSDGVRPLATCELLDAATRKWSATGPMKYARARHTATLLPNGNVLVAGGATPSSAAVNTAEIYYPASRTWVQTTPMFETRQNHTATLLPDGNVLVAGGATQSTYTATAEVFISSNSYWVRGPNLPAYAMGTPRAQHTATLLRNGNVLMAGGVNGFGAVNTSEFYDYRNMRFTAGPAMTIGRYGHTANLLRDGRVILLGGSDNYIGRYTGEIYSPAAGAWDNTGLLLTYSRTGHRSVLLPNGKLLVTGGEDAGAVREFAEGFDPDFPFFSPQGTTGRRAYHTSVVLPDNYILNIGGWDGARYLDTTDLLYFSYFPDMDGREADPARNPLISTGTVLFDRGDRLTLQSGTTNFHGFTEASGGGAGPMSSSHSNPRVYMQQIDNPSGYMIDMSTYIYSHYGGLYSAGTWETSLSSITIVTPSAPWDLPHGWYHVRVANNGQFSPGFTVQVTTPRPTGLATEPAPVAGSIGRSSITWNWTSGTIAAAEGYSLYASSNGVFITTMAFVSPANYTQTGLSPNTAASVMVSAYNLGGYGPLAKSATYYTLAATPSTLTVTSASFETASLHWYPNGNTPVTQYEVSMSPDNFVDPLSISTPVPFSVNHVSTAVTINQLSADQVYFFRVRARNGDGVPTGFNTDIDPAVSTITVSGITNLTGSPFSATAINWAWDDIEETGIYYEVYDVTTGSQTFVSSATTSYPFFTQEGLLPNTRHIVTVNAAKNVPGVGPVRGPKALSRAVFTRTVQLLPATPNIFTNVSTGSFVASWITNGNPDGTAYGLFISTHADFVEYSSATTADNPVSGGLSYNFTGLEPNVRYYLRVNAVNGDGQTGSTLDLGSRYTLANPPARVIPLEVTMSGVTLGWDTASNSSATIYEVRGTTENFTLSVTTYVPFAALYDQNYARLTGLLTATTYYFDVAARNGDGRITSRIQAYYDGVDDPGIYTLPGPGSSPPGSVGGTSAVNAASTISGTLPDGRPVSLYIPSGAFPATTAIAISSSATNPCSYLVGGRPIEVAIYSENDAQPLEPVTLTLYYNSAESNAAIDANRNRMVIARYNPVSGQCLPLETRIDPGPRTITATLNHFSVFQLIVRTASAGLSDVLVYPNPFYTNRGNGFVTIANIPAAAKVRVYTLSGEKVWDGTAGNTGLIIWRGVNKSGELVASGVYLAVIDSSAGKKVVKIAVER